MKSCFFLSCLSTAHAQTLPSLPNFPNAELQEISDSRYWHLLLHYKRNLLSGVTSEADGPEFFLSPHGKANPLAELEATLASFYQPERRIGPLKQPPACAFPERFRFLNEKLNLNLKAPRCPDFDEWKPRFSPQSATLVFASAYLNNPASMFGHTFLRVDSKPRRKQDHKNDLLDYGVNFAAKTGEDGGITFAVLGLIGGYPGYFSLLPYFEKVHEYSDVESRELWEYPLSLKPDQLDRMINHIWELGTTYFDYYFFDENCSYHLLALLEVAEPEWNLQNSFFYWVIPSDTIRQLKKIPDALHPPKFRPSLFQQLQTRISLLSPGEKTAFFQLASNRYDLQGNESTPLIDALMDYKKYDLMKNERNPNDEDLKEQRKLLLARAKKGDQALSAVQVPIPEHHQPDKGVESAKLSLLSGVHKRQTYLGFQIRPVYHDVLDPDPGYLPGSEITMGRTQFRYIPKQNKFRLEEAYFAEVVSLVPRLDWSKSLSWSVKAGVRTPLDLECAFCHAPTIDGGAGLSWSLGATQEMPLLTTLLKGNLDYQSRLDSRFRIGPSLLVSALHAFHEQWKIRVEGEYFWFVNQPREKNHFLQTRAQLGFWLKPQFELRLTHTGIRSSQDLQGSFSWYF